MKPDMMYRGSVWTDPSDRDSYRCQNTAASMCMLPCFRNTVVQHRSSGQSSTGDAVFRCDDHAVWMKGFDTGDMHRAKAEVALGTKMRRAAVCLTSLAEAGEHDLCVHTILAIEAGNVRVYTKQNEAGRVNPLLRHACWIKTDGKYRLDTSRAVAIERLIRGLNPWPSAYTHLERKDIKDLACSSRSRRRCKRCGKSGHSE